MSDRTRACVLGLALTALLLASVSESEAVVYSEAANTSEMAWIWVPASGGSRVPILPADLGLVAGDDVDALSLGDDYGKFDNVRRDLFAVQAGAVGTSGDLQTRVAAGVRVERDVYIEHRTKVNKVEYPDLIAASAGDETPSRGIDAFDIGVLDQGDWIHFSLAPGSPTLAAMGYSAGDVLVCQYKIAATLSVYAPACDIGGPTDISALSIHDSKRDGIYDSTSDYLVYAKPIPGDATIYHYGLNHPSTNQAHEFSQFGLDNNDVVSALEHIPLPRPEQDVGECVAPDDYYTAETSGLSTVSLGPITIHQAFLPDGTPLPLSVTDCMGNGHLAVQVPWSESSAQQNAVITFDENLCPEGDPKAVGIYLAHGTPITLNAVDADGVVVDTVGDSGNNPADVQLLILESESGIRKVEIEGAEICILMICYYCDEPPTEPGPEPGPGGCVSADDVYTAETTGLSEVTLGPVTIREALLPDGTPVPLNVRDCDGDGILDVEVPWSESNATRLAVIEFADTVCDGEAPKVVDLIVAHGTAIKFMAYDDDGVVMDDVSDSGSDPTVIQTLTLDSETGIRKIEIEGAELCILDICWYCEEMEPGPGPGPEPGPEPPRKLVVYEFDQLDLASDGWVEVPGGFTGANPGRILPFDFSSEMIPSSRDMKGLAITVKTGDVATIRSKVPVDTQGGPVLIRMTARADAADAAIALAALKGDLNTGQDLDWSIATHIPSTAASFVQGERRLVLVYEPDSGQLVTPIIQVASTLGPEQSREVTVIIDRLEVLALDPYVFGSTPTGPNSDLGE